jgi:hypothetical protein
MLYLLIAAKNSVRPSEGVAGGGGWGEEFRHARAKDRGRTRRPARQSRATQKSFLFLLEEKIGRAQIRKSKENFFVERAGLRHGGGAASSGVFLKMGSSNVQNFPQKPNLPGGRLVFVGCRIFRQKYSAPQTGEVE